MRFQRLARALLLPVLFSGSLSAAAVTVPPAKPRSVEYEISFPNAVHHEAEVSVTFTGVPPAKPLQVRMSHSSPGRYALHEFAQNVYRVRAVDQSGRPLSIDRPDPYGWNVTPHGPSVRIE